ncbi:hypothetical protein [Methylobacter luteus]|uniref:hypothetical protein n=1 Tax=Methylobacter luteus TaxID=415 RepID=UPI000420E998|nr:hypothetical protein [Methylobacter luteus]
MLKKLGLTVLLLLGHSAADAAVRDFTLHIDDGDLTITGAGGTTLSVWGYGETAGLLFTLPSTSGTWYPQVVYKKLRDNAPYATVYGKITF